MFSYWWLPTISVWTPPPRSYRFVFLTIHTCLLWCLKGISNLPCIKTHTWSFCYKSLSLLSKWQPPHFCCSRLKILNCHPWFLFFFFNCTPNPLRNSANLNFKISDFKEVHFLSLTSPPRNCRDASIGNFKIVSNVCLLHCLQGLSLFLVLFYLPSHNLVYDVNTECQKKTKQRKKTVFKLL